MTGFFRARGGAAAVEFALAAPVLILLAAGVAEIGRAFMIHNALNRLAAQYASAWADCVDSGASCQTELAQYTSTYAIRNIAPNLTVTNLTLAMAQVTMAGTTPVVAWGSPASLNATQTAAVQANFASGQTGVVVYVAYSFSLAYFPKLLNSALTNALNPSYTFTQIKN